MARADPHLIDARTDVYLLGGVLFEVLTGRLPHEAPTAVAALVLALRGELPAFPADVPAELADLARRSMAPAAEDRVAGAEAFREGLAQFLASREVARAVAEARQALSRARELISKDGPSSLDAFRALVEARITFASAHRARPQDATIRADLDAAVTHLVERELVLRSPIGARTLLAELGTPSPDLQARVDALESQLAAEREAAEAHLKARAEADLSPALRVGPLILLSVPLVLFVAQLAWKSTSTSSALAVSSAAIVAVFSVLFLQRRVLLTSQGLRRLAGFMIMMGVNLLFVPLVMIGLGNTFLSDITTVSFASYALMWAVHSLTTRGVWPNVLGLAGTGGALAFPHLTHVLPVPVTTLMLIIWVRAARVTAARERGSEPPPQRT